MTASPVIVGVLDAAQIRSVIASATRAPSLHNSQPWYFRCVRGGFEVHADLRRELPATDPDHREVFLACGAALLNVRLAVRSLGFAADVRVLPDPFTPTLIGTVTPAGPLSPTQDERELAAAIPRRHTNRRPYSADRVPESVIHALRQAARLEQAWLAVVPAAQHSNLRTLLDRAHRGQLEDPAFVDEWAAWTGRPPMATAGVPAESAGPSPEPQDVWVRRDFGAGSSQVRQPGKDFEPDPLIAVVGTFHDLLLAQVQAGQAMQRILLRATADGVSASFLSQVIEVREIREDLRGLIGGGLWPQVVLRFGYGPPTTATPRRPVDEVLVTEDGRPSTNWQPEH